MKNIVLIGMSGSGKSTVGKYIADKLNKTFLDTDDIIVSNTGKNIEYIFDNYGEGYFRELEKLVINSLSRKEDIIISTGGGIVLNPTNIEILKRKGIIFFLNGSIDTLYQNVKKSKASKEQRPLLREGDLKIKLEEIYNIRKSLYFNSGDYIISVDNRTVEEIGNEIIKIFKTIIPCP
ncbi:MAG: shikimate kinase [Tissierellia bacterium]|nr:shikimate kinase [Tissierellia bacterium]